jgi:hypothetical protein
MTHWWRQPVAGDFVWCFFPQDELLEPGPKPRPALVLKVRRVLGFENQFAVEVAYGTSQKVDSLFPGEFLLDRNAVDAFQLSGLSYPTKFDLSKTAELPYNSEWFGLPPRPRYGHIPKLGTLHPSMMHRLKAAREAAKPDGH